ncbi:unnamed protein product [Rotaria sp. Silwood2]|nr:unnamed protein product [Rotaria sp. Silwood2]
MYSLSNEYCVRTELYAVVGARAFLGGISRMTVSLVVIVDSMTIPQIDLLIQHHSHSIYPVVINEHFSSIVRQVNKEIY